MIAVPVLSFPTNKLISGAVIVPVIGKVNGFSSASSPAMVMVELKDPVFVPNSVIVKFSVEPAATEVMALQTHSEYSFRYFQWRKFV